MRIVNPCVKLHTWVMSRIILSCEALMSSLLVVQCWWDIHDCAHSTFDQHLKYIWVLRFLLHHPLQLTYWQHTVMSDKGWRIFIFTARQFSIFSIIYPALIPGILIFPAGTFCSVKYHAADQGQVCACTVIPCCVAVQLSQPCFIMDYFCGTYQIFYYGNFTISWKSAVL